MASSKDNIVEELNASKLQSHVVDLHKLALMDIPLAEKHLRSLPVLCRLLELDQSLDSSIVIGCLQRLSLTVEEILSMFVYSCDWNAAEAFVILMVKSKHFRLRTLINSLEQPKDKVLKEIRRHEMRVLDKSLLSIYLKEALIDGMNTGSYVLLNILLRLMPVDRDKRNYQLDEDGNTLLHLACELYSKQGLLNPIWFIGWGINPQLTNKKGQMASDLLPDDLPFKRVFLVASENEMVCDLAYMDTDDIRRYLLQQFCASGRSINLSELCERLDNDCNGIGFEAVTDAYKMHKLNTAWKLLLDKVDYSIEGLSILLNNLKLIQNQPGTKTLIQTVENVIWRLRYESLGMSCLHLQWLDELCLQLSPDENLTWNTTVYNRRSIEENLQSSIWYNSRLHGSVQQKPKEKKMSKRSHTRKSSSSGQAEKLMSNYEKHLCDNIEHNQNAAVYLPCSTSHMQVAAELIQTHIFYLADLESREDDEVIPKETMSSCTDSSVKKENNSRLMNETDSPHSSRKKQQRRVNEETKLMSSGDVPDSPRKKEKTFYMKQRQKKHQRQRGSMVSEDSDGHIKIRSSSRRRTRSSGDSLRYLENDMAQLCVKQLNISDTNDNSNVCETCNILLVVPSKAIVCTYVKYFTVRLQHLTVVEHGTSKSKIGLNKALKSGDVVVCHLNALKNCLQAKSVNISDINLLLFADMDYDDELLLLLPDKLNAGLDIIMMFRSLPCASDPCSLPSILRFIQEKLKSNQVVAPEQQCDMIKKMYPNIICMEETFSSLYRDDGLVKSLKHQVSTAYGTYGSVSGFLVCINLSEDLEEFAKKLEVECQSILPGTVTITDYEPSDMDSFYDAKFYRLNTCNQPHDCRDRTVKFNLTAFIVEVMGTKYLKTIKELSLPPKCMHQMYTNICVLMSKVH